MALSTDSQTVPERAAALEHCRRVTFDRARNFAYAFLFLSKSQQDALCAAYAWCRLVDDIADDEDQPEVERMVALEREEQSLLEIARGGKIEPGPHAAVHKGLQVLLEESNVRVEDLQDLIFGMKQDLHKKRYETFAELYEYCYHAASTVGLICLEIFGYEGSEARSLAADMGVALQLTNILRDIKEDLERDRIYLPRVEWAAHGITEEDLRRDTMSPQVKLYLESFGKRALRYYKRSEALLPQVQASSRLCPSSLHRIYKGLLLEIARRDYDVFTGRVSLKKRTKLRLAAGLWIQSWLWT